MGEGYSHCLFGERPCVGVSHGLGQGLVGATPAQHPETQGPEIESAGPEGCSSRLHRGPTLCFPESGLGGRWERVGVWGILGVKLESRWVTLF